MEPRQPLPPEALYRSCDPAEFEFETTADLPPLAEMVGQERAVEAVELGIAMDQQGFNVFVLGPPGTGRHSFVRRFLTEKASTEPAASDWCYVNNFDEARKPVALELPPGRGRQLRDDLGRFMDEAFTAIPAAFESDSYRTRRQRIEEEIGRQQTARLEGIGELARAKGIALVRTPAGIAFAPMRDGKAIPREEFENLSTQEKERLESETQELGEQVQDVMKAMPQLVRKAKERIRELDREIATLATSGLIDELVRKYAFAPMVVAFLKRVQADIADNVALFAASPTEEQPQLPPALQQGLASMLQPKEPPARRRYSVNVLVDRSSARGAPVVFEDHPTYQNLIGEIEYLSQMGALVTDFGLIRSGALHRANGGYLVLDAHKVLFEPFAWQGLKQALEAREIRIEPVGHAYLPVRTVTLEPESIPLGVKVVLVGERWLYYMLLALDPDFAELFKVAADFDDRFDRNLDNDRLFAQLLGTLVRQEQLKPVDRSGIARLIEESSRHAEHSGKLSAQVRKAADIMREANLWATRRGKDVVQADDVQHAIDRRVWRESRLRARLQEEILEDTILIDTSGEQVGQVNGLAVIEVGEFAFARPNRITARVALGSGTVVDIEREAKLGGPLHSKGVLILSGFLSSHYVADRPLSLSASLVLEQSYGGVEGDSASSAELYALLSALAEAPIKQSLAVTGSVNQHGQIQAIGGVNQKIEGFFDVCCARGLDGTHGVLIPVSNVKNLMLRRDVIDAVTEGRFHIYPVRTVDEGLAILTGIPSGTRQEDGSYPEGTLGHRIRTRLFGFAERRQAYMSDAGRSSSA